MAKKNDTPDVEVTLEDRVTKLEKDMSDHKAKADFAAVGVRKLLDFIKQQFGIVVPALLLCLGVNAQAQNNPVWKPFSSDYTAATCEVAIASFGGTATLTVQKVVCDTVTANSVITNGVTYLGDLTCTAITDSGAASVGTTLAVTGITGLSSNLNVGAGTNKFTVLGTSGNTAVAGTLGVTGAGTFSSTLGVTGITGLSSNLNVGAGTNKFTVLGTSGNTAIAGTLGVTGLTTMTGNGIADELDSVTATALLVGKATATSVTIGATDAGTTIAGALTASQGGTLTSMKMVSATIGANASANIANGGTLTFDPGKIVMLTPTGAALDAACTITIPKLAPSYAGTNAFMYVVCDPTASNTLAIASSGTYLGTPLAVATGDTACIVFFGNTNYFSSIGQ